MNIVDTITKKLQDAEALNEERLMAHAMKVGDDVFKRMCNASANQWSKISHDDKWWYQLRLFITADVQASRIAAASLVTQEDCMRHNRRIVSLIAGHVKAVIADPEGRAEVRGREDTISGGYYIMISIPTDPPVESQ